MQVDLNLRCIELWLQVFVLLVNLSHLLAKSGQLPFILHILLFFRHKRHLNRVLLLLKWFNQDSITLALNRILLHGWVIIEASILFIIVATTSYLVLAVSAFVIVTVLLSYFSFQLDNFALHGFILHHNLMKLCLRAGQEVELLNEVLVDRLLKLIDLLDQFAEPVAVWA